MDKFTHAYIEAALWSTNDDNEPLDKNFSIDDLSPETQAKMTTDCINFQQINKAVLDIAYDLYPDKEWSEEEQAGHDFWLTRNGLGAGFWDRGLGEVGDTLTQICNKDWGEFHLYVGDDKKIYY